MKSLQTVPLHYQSVGENGVPIVVLHGLFGSADNWRTLAMHMGAQNQTVIVDQRNHGHSPHAAPWDYAHMAADVVALINSELAGQPVHLVGHSMGGKTAMWLAAHYPDLVATLTVVDMAPGANRRGHDAILAALNAVPIDTLGQRRDAEEILVQKGIQEPSIRQFLLKGLYRTDSGFAWRYNLPLITQSYDNILTGMEHNPVFDKPTLFMRGGASPYVKDTDLPLIARLFPNYTLETIPNAGHWLHAEAPAAFVQVLGQFLNIPFAPLS